MNRSLTFTAAALLALSAAPAIAQTPTATTTPPAGEVNPPAVAAPSTAAPSAAASGANASVTAGMAVMDNTGLTIGQITEVKAGAAGKQTATIKMGADTFAVETDRLSVMGRNAQVNATQAEIKTMLGKK